jgi:phage terminase large subunit GpA-like protein
VKGHKGKGRPPVLRPGKAKDKAIHLFIVGVDVVKNRVFSRLRIKPPQPGQKPAPGYMHFRTEQENGADAAYLRQFGNEIAVPRKLPNGEMVHVYKKKGPNEAVDLEVYAYTALHVLGDAVRLNLGALAERLGGPAIRSPDPAKGGALRPQRAVDGA